MSDAGYPPWEPTPGVGVKETAIGVTTGADPWSKIRMQAGSVWWLRGDVMELEGGGEAWVQVQPDGRLEFKKIEDHPLVVELSEQVNVLEDLVEELKEGV